MAASPALEAYRAARLRGLGQKQTYLQWYKTTLPAGYTVPKHIAFLCEIAQKVLDGELMKVGVSIPPGHGKSTTITHRFPVRWGMDHPQDASVFTGYNQTFAEKNLSKPAREIARELGVLSGSTSAMDQWELTNGARLLARGVGVAPTGVNPISCIVADDPIRDRAQAASQVERENIWDWWQGSIVQRFWPRTRVFLIQTRWHEDDLFGRLKAQNDPSWTFINLPAIAEEGDPLGREPGEALWPEAKPIEFLEGLRREMGEYHFQALYQGNPTPREGSFFQVSKLQIVSETPANLDSCMGIDLAASKGQGDYTAAPLWSGPDSEGLFYVRPWRVQEEPAERNRLLRQRADVLNPRLIRWPQDPGAAGKESAQFGIRLMAGHNIKAEPVSGDKELRAEPQAAQINAGNVRLVCDGSEASRKGCSDFIEEYRQFPNGKHDDQVDGSSDAFNALSKPTTRTETYSASSLEAVDDYFASPSEAFF